MKRAQHILISGRVQGVSYRYFAKTCAEKLGIAGWVRNLKDGRVEALALGSEERLQQLAQMFLRGPAQASVSGIEAQFIQHKQDYESFEIVEDGDKPCAKKKL